MLLTTQKVSKSHPYQSKLIIQTYASAFKFIKDVQDHSDAPLPPSKHPKTILAIVTTAVSQSP